MAITIPILSEFNEKGINQAESAFGKMGKIAGAAFAAVGAAAAATAAKAAVDFVGFERKMNEVFTLLPGISQEAMGDMMGQVKDFSKEFGVLPNEVVPALYQALSAGVPPENVFTFLEVAQKAAVGGITDLQTAVDGITSVVNAYGDEVISAAEASDLMFTAVRLGKTDFEQLSSSIFQIAPIASSLGVGFDVVTAALANLTAQGVPTSVAATQLKAAFSELGKQGTKADKAFQNIAGVGFTDFIKTGGTVEQALLMLKTGADDAGISVLDMFGSIEAGQAVLALTADGGLKFAETLEEMANSAGATDDAFGQMMTGLGPMIDKLKAEFAVIMLEIGQRIVPILTDALTKARGVFDRIVPVIRTFVDAFRQDGLGGLARVAGEAIPKVLEKLRELGAALLAWVGEQIPVWVEKLQALGQALLEWIGPRIGPMLKQLGELIGKAAQWVLDEGLPMLVDKLVKLGNALVEWIGPNIKPMLKELGKFLVAITNWIVTEALPKIGKEALKLAGAMLSWIADLLPKALSGLASFIVDLIKELPGLFLDLIKTAADLGGQVGTAILNGIVEAVKKIINFGGEIAKGLVNAIIGFINTQFIQRINRLLEFRIPLPFGKSFTINPPDIPDIPFLAEGGIVTGPTLAVVAISP